MQLFLFDTNLISELRKGKRCDSTLLWWMKTLSEEQAFLSVITLGEVRFGIELLRTRDARQSISLELWLENTMLTYEGRILPVTEDIAEEWGKLRTIRNIPVADSLIAATAVCHSLTVATRNEKDFQYLGVKVYNPFAS